MRKRKQGPPRALQMGSALLTLALVAGLAPASFPARADEPAPGETVRASACIIARADNAAAFSAEPVIGELDGTYLLAYESAEDARDAIERLAPACEFAEMDGTLRAADAQREESGDAPAYAADADPFTLATQAMDAGEDAGDDAGILDGLASLVAGADAGDGDEQAPDADGTQDAGEGGPAEAGDDAGAETPDSDDPRPLIALVDSGAPDSPAIVDAVSLVEKDPAIRLAAYFKIQPLVLFGQGHGDRMNEAVEAYAKFLSELARCKLPRGELSKLLDDADAKLKGVLEE